MKIAKNINELAQFMTQNKEVNIGFVPTMGALHPGHLSLVKAASSQTDYVVVSLFVNPLQFNNPIDLEKYPRNIEGDIALLENSGCNLLFAPSVDDIYPQGVPNIELDIKDLESVMEGKMRKGHFQGVVQVLHRLFSLINPQKAFFGLKDYQQCLVVKRLVDTYFSDIQLFFEPTMREASGLAMSSRNQRLSLEGKKEAAEIYRKLIYCRSLYPAESPLNIIEKGKAEFKKQGLEVEYLEIVEAETLRNPIIWEKNKKYIILAAVYIESVRLIDNLFLN